MTETDSSSEARVSVPFEEMRAFERIADAASAAAGALGIHAHFCSGVYEPLERLSDALLELTRVQRSESRAEGVALIGALKANLAVVPTPPRTVGQMAALAAQQEWSL